MVKLFEIVAHITTPLGIAGVVIIVLFLLFRLLIKGPLAAQLSRSHSYQVINRIVTFVFILGLVALTLSIGVYILGKVLPAPLDSMLRTKEHLEAVQTGGDTFAYLMLYHFDTKEAFARQLAIILEGKYTLYNVRVSIRDMDRAIEIYNQLWGEISPPAVAKVGIRWPLGDSVYYRIAFSARNGHWSQDLILKRSNALGYWPAATRVYDKYNKKVVIEHIDKPDFINEFGEPAWRR
jgi:hypothetical protein